MKSRSKLVKIPRDMPLLLSILDDLTTRSPVSSTYLALWCHKGTGDVVHVSDARRMAFFSNLTGQRGEKTWRSRLKMLADLRFITILRDGPENLSIRILDPYRAVQALSKGKALGLRSDKYEALVKATR